MVVKLQGGLGNQMFQVAYGVTQAFRRGEAVYFDRSGIVPPRTYALDPFKLPIEFKDNSPDAEVGYWQGERWFDPGLIRPLFSEPHAKKPYGNGVAVHVRLTDNLSERALAFHGNLLDTDYYDRAMKLISQRVADPVFLVFSDDPDWCARNLTWPRRSIIWGNPAHVDLWEMARCPYAIIANSSFSWWGAWLGPQKLVIAPKRWFVVPVPGEEDIVPERWVRI